MNAATVAENKPVYKNKVMRRQEKEKLFFDIRRQGYLLHLLSNCRSSLYLLHLLFSDRWKTGPQMHRRTGPLFEMSSARCWG